MTEYIDPPWNHWNGSNIEIIDIELCHFHASGPIGLHMENTKWPISRKRKIFVTEDYLTKCTYYGPLSHGSIKFEILMQDLIWTGVLTTTDDDDGRVGDSIGSPCEPNMKKHGY